ncbi:hypothetical protein CI105_06025 [Candidatus Izimaplasma bacterium ZiA1]|uniref:NAD(P)-dependent alcohol dehydrogenase n=1 Tax=Candidatus Izimoplasma sp. ZiA1 TaxID=2024899 RepID=UPI000BAA4B2D|nr:hypothetical protein CI105_06025 [Candidatus Izimaplasma bacterium ZiA1]
MKAIKYIKYGLPKNVSYEEIEKPTINDDLVLVEIHSASINQADLYLLQGKPLLLRLSTGLFKPKNNILGSDISGVISLVGKNVTEFKIGDEVFGELGMNQDGGYAEYALASPKQLTKKPKEISHSVAASVPMAGLTALQGLRLANISKDSNILIYGASGGVGTFMIQVAKSFGATVTAVVSTRNIEVAKNSGADHIIDYNKQVWYESNNTYDIVIAANGENKLKVYRDKLTDSGIFVMSGGSIKQLLGFFIKKPFMRKKKERQFLNYVAKVNKDDLAILSNMLKNNQLRPYIDKEFSLKDTENALSHFYEGKTIGKTIIKLK